MRHSEIRHLAACDEVSLVLAAFLESKVQVWSWETTRQLGAISTVLDLGGRRLAIAPAGNICVAGSWRKGLTGGLAAYSVPSGALLWHRKDIQQVQHVTLSASGREVYWG